jgi:glycosyltransferase involved in cell wall biosynthesis
MLGQTEKDVISFGKIMQRTQSGGNRLRFLVERQTRSTFGAETITMYSRDLTGLLGNSDAEIIHCHDAMSAWAAVRIRKRHHSPWKVVVTVHGPNSRHMIEEGQDPSSPDVRKAMRCEQEAWQSVDAIIAVDSTQAAIIQEQGGAADKITIIPNAVDMEKLSNYDKSLPVARKEKRPWILVPRRLYPKNGVEYAIRALATMKRKPRLLIAGDGIQKAELHELVTALNLWSDVVFLGTLSHAVLIPLMREADIVTIPSVPAHGIVEATSIAALEAMALEKAVVASSIGGLCELIVDGRTGILVPPADPSALAAAWEGLIAKSELRRNIGRASRISVSKNFCKEVWFKKIAAVYSSMYAQSSQKEN